MMELNLTAPENWKSLSEKQLIYATWLLTQGDLTAEEIQAYAFVRFCGLKVVSSDESKSLYRYKKLRFELSAEESRFFSRKFSFLTSAIDEVTPIAKLKGCTHVDLRLRDVPLSQYLALENYYQAFLFTRKEEFLHKLCAAFYTDGKIFDDSKTEKRSAKFASLPFHVRYTVFLWFSGLKTVLKNHFRNYFIEVDTSEDDAPQAPNMRKQIEQMLLALNGGDATKNDAIYEVDTWAALAVLDAKAFEYNLMKQKMKK